MRSREIQGYVGKLKGKPEETNWPYLLFPFRQFPQIALFPYFRVYLQSKPTQSRGKLENYPKRRIFRLIGAIVPIWKSKDWDRDKSKKMACFWTAFSFNLEIWKEIPDKLSNFASKRFKLFIFPS